MPTETSTDLRVRYAETDQMGVVYHANYLVWCELGRTDFIRSLGKAYAEFEREGVRLAVSDATLRFHASARYDDPVRVFTQLSDLRSRSMTFSYRIINAETGVTLVTASTTLIAIDANAKIVTMPASLRTMMQGALAKPAGAVT